MRDELKFQQRWEFRRKDNDLDSSSDDSRSSSIGQLVLKKHKLASSMISLDDDETCNASRLELNHSSNPGLGDQTEFAKGKEKKIKRVSKQNIADGEVKSDSRQGINRKKSKSIVYDPAAIHGVKNFTESLLEELQVKRANLFSWMRDEMNKLVADDNALKKGRRKRNSKRNSRGKKVQSQQHNNFETNVHFQQHNDNEEDVRAQHLNNFKSGLRVQNSRIESLEKITKSNKSSETSDQVACGQPTGPLTSLEKEKGKKLAFTVNTSGASDQNVQVQHPKSVVLAIRALNSNDGSSEKSIKGKRTGNFNKQYQAREDRVGYSQAVESMISTEKDKAERMRLSVDQSFSPSNPTQQVASSMYLTLPTVLTKSHDSNNRLDTFLSNYIQPRVSENKTSVNLEEAKQMHDCSTHFGYLPNIQLEGKSTSFAQMGSIDTSYLNHSGNQSSSTGIGCPIPLHQYTNGFSIPSQFLLENIPQENDNTLGMQMNGGAITFPGGSYASSENFVTNNLLSQSDYRADGRLRHCQIPSITDAYLFPK